MELSVITVTLNSDRHIADQLRSVQTAGRGFEIEQIVVDNNSSDETVSLIERDFPQVKLIKNSANLGFGVANNQGAKIASGRFFLLLNPDMKMSANGLRELLDYFKQQPKIGLLGCRLTDEKGKLNLSATPRRLPRLWEVKAIFWKLPHLFPNILNRYLYRDLDFNKPQQVDTVRGAFMLLRREIYERLGRIFDPRYFIWFEDVDLCREIKKLGYEVWYSPLLSCQDFVGQTFRGQNFWWKQWQFFKSAWLYFSKWGLML